MDKAKEDKIDYWLAKQEIRDCLNRVARGRDRLDRDLYLSAFHPDAVLDAGAFVGSPMVAFGSGTVAQKDTPFSLHSLLTHNCEVDGDVAHAETYFQWIGRPTEEKLEISGGRYCDRLEYRDGKWKITFRLTILEWAGNIARRESKLFSNVPDLHANGRSSPSISEDASYIRPLTNKRALTQT